MPPLYLNSSFFASPVFASVVVDGSAGYVTASNGFTYGVSLDDGTVRWRAPIGGAGGSWNPAWCEAG